MLWLTQKPVFQLELKNWFCFFKDYMILPGDNLKAPAVCEIVEWWLNVYVLYHEWQGTKLAKR
jgi:hypothetical protein